MKARFCIGIAIMILLMVGVISAQTSQVNAAKVLGGSPGEIWITDDITDNPNMGKYVSIALDEDHNDRPWIAFYNETYGSLMVAHYVGAGNGDCNANDAWKCEQVDQVHGESKGLFTSIAVHPDTNPDPIFSTWKVGVSYFDETNRTLKYAQYRCPLSGCEWTIQTVDSSTDGSDWVGQFTSLKIGSNGIANISYHMYDDMGDFRRGIVKYAYYMGSGSGDCGDDNDWVCQDIDAAFVSVGVNYGSYTSLDLDDENRVYISYYDGNAGDLKYAYYIGFGGSCGNSGDWNCLVIDDGDGDDVGLFSSFHASKNNDDYMRVAYYNQTAGSLMYAYDISGTGNCGQNNGWQCNIIEKIGADLSQIGISLVVDAQNNPVIAYSEVSSDLAPMGLKVASPAYFEPYANCAGQLFFDWWCRTVDDGDAYLEDAQFLGLGIKSNGLAVIAYSELDTYAYPVETNLKFAYQAARSLLPLVAK